MSALIWGLLALAVLVLAHVHPRRYPRSVRRTYGGRR